MTIVSDVTSVVNGDDEEFQKYKCPVLFGQVVTVSGLDSEERLGVKQLVESAGNVPLLCNGFLRNLMYCSYQVQECSKNDLHSLLPQCKCFLISYGRCSFHGVLLYCLNGIKVLGLAYFH